MQQSVRNLWAKFEVDSLSRFRTGARQVFTTQKLFPSEISVTMKIATTNSLFKYIFWSNNYHLSNLFWNPWRQTNRYSSKEVNIWATSGYFPFFIPFFCWNEIKKKSSRHEKDQKQSLASACNFIKKRLCPRCFPVNFAKFPRILFQQNTSSGYFWKMENCKGDNIAEKFFT